MQPRAHADGATTCVRLWRCLFSYEGLPKVRLSLLLCHHPAERPIKIPEGFDGLYYPPGMEKVPRRLAIVRANRYMVDHADFLIAYALHPASNARQLVEYANRRAKKGAIRVTNLAQPGQNER